MPLSRLGAGSLQSDTVGTLQISDGTIVSADLANGSVTADKLASGAVPTQLPVLSRSGNVNITITNGSFTVTARSGNISVGVS